MKTVSVVISAYNHENFVGECLESVMKQTYPNIELIVLNDGSKDRTHHVISAYENELRNRFLNYIYINKENEGISKSFNRGIQLASGTYIKPFASDDVMMPNAIEKLVHALESNPDSDVAYGDGYHFDTPVPGKKKKLKRAQRFSKIADFKSGHIYDHLLDMLPLISSCTVMYTRESFERVGGYDEDLACEDMDLYLRLSRKHKFVYVDDILILHRISAKNAGYNPDIMLPSLHKMLDKYDRTGFFSTEEERDKYLEIINWTERVLGVIDFPSKAEGKKVVIWGTGGFYKKYKDDIFDQVEFLVDSARKKQYKTMDGKMIYPPKRLLREKGRDDLFICVMSMYYKDIYKWLSAKGFVYKKHYF